MEQTPDGAHFTPPTNDKEYKYFYTFIKHTKPKTSHDPTINLIQLNKEILKLVDIVISREYDLDGRRFQSAYILALIIDLCADLENISPLMRSDIINTFSFTSVKISLANLISAATNIFSSYLNLITNSWDHARNKVILQTNMWQFTIYLYQLTELKNIHRLMIHTIELHSHSHIMTERYDLMSENPHMKYSYELHSVLPLTYHWSPKSYKLRYFPLGNKLTMGQDYSLSYIIKTFHQAVMEKMSEPGHTENEVKLMLSNLFQLSDTEFDINDRKSFIWPLMTHLQPKSYEEIWNKKHLHVPQKTDTPVVKSLKDRQKEEIEKWASEEGPMDWEAILPGLDFVYSNGPGF